MNYHEVFLVKAFDISFTKIYVFKVTNRDARERCEICSELTIETSERFQNDFFEHSLHLFLVFL